MGRKRRRKQFFPRSIAQPIPRYKKAVLTYAAYKSYDPSSTATAVQDWAANGLYDPDITGVGHQPMGFDQLMDQYSNYYVYKVQVKTVWMPATNPPNDVTTSFIVGSSIGHTVGSTEAIDQRLERNKSVYKWFNHNTPGGVYTTQTVKPWKSLGIPFKDDANMGDASTNPSTMLYVSTFADTSSTHPTDANALTGWTIIRYWALFTNPKLFAQS